MNFRWDLDKNKVLKETRGVCFEDVVSLIYEDKILDIIKHPNEEKYPDQRIYMLEIIGYVHMVPFEKKEDEIFLKTIVPSRKMNRIYKGGHNEV